MSAQTVSDSDVIQHIQVKTLVRVAGATMESIEQPVAIFADGNFGKGSRARHIELADALSTDGTPNQERIRLLQVGLLHKSKFIIIKFLCVHKWMF